MRHIITNSNKSEHIRVFLNIPTQANDTANTIIIFVPGLLETAKTPLFVKTAETFSTQESFATARIDSSSFYGCNSRLNKTSISGQVQDLTDTITHFRKSFDYIVLIGHSMGAFISLLANDAINVNRIIMWDPSLHPRKIFSSAEYNSTLNQYYDPYLRQEVSSDLIEELPRLSEIETIASRSSCPVGVISAELGAVGVVNSYTENLHNLLGHSTIKEADHNFSNSQHTAELVDKTVFLIKKTVSSETVLETMRQQ